MLSNCQVQVHTQRTMQWRYNMNEYLPKIKCFACPVMSQETWRHITKDFKVPTNGTSEATIPIPEPTIASKNKRVTLNIWGRSFCPLSPPYVFWPTQVWVQWTVFSVVLINDENECSPNDENGCSPNNENGCSPNNENGRSPNSRAKQVSSGNLWRNSFFFSPCNAPLQSRTVPLSRRW